MNIVHRFKVACLPLIILQLLVAKFGFGQADLRIDFDPSVLNLNSVQVGSYFSIQGAVSLDVNSSTVPAGETIVATIQFIDPDGLIIDSHTQTWNGFPENGNPGNLDNDTTTLQQVLFQVPWSEAAKWGPTEQWQVVARVTGAALESDLTDNVVDHSFGLQIPNLVMADANVTGTTFLPNADVVVSARVSNLSSVQTQNGVFFPVEARLFEGSITAATGPIDRNVLDRERLIIPFADQGITPTLLANDSISFNLPPLRLPADAEGNYTIQVIVDPNDMQPLGSILAESEESTDNHLLINFSITDGLPNLQVNPESFTGEVGTFRGLEPVRIGFTIRNDSNFAVEPSDNFTAQVLLSDDLIFNPNDFILREFDLGGNALGAELLPNETIQLDWIQQMPDNFEGDYYLLLHITETGQVFPLQPTPVISLNSKNEGQIKIADYDENSSSTEIINQILDLREQITVLAEIGLQYNGNVGGEIAQLQGQIDVLVVELGYAVKTPPRDRPNTSNDGRWLVYETSDYRGIQQIFLVNVFAQRNTNQNAVLISRSLDNPNVGGNANSLRARISADGSFVAFHSRANDLVTGDNNDVEDIFIYSTYDNRLIRLTNPITGEEGDAASYYPDINEDGSVITFESRASNLTTGTSFSNGKRQIYLWHRKVNTTDTVRLITNGNGNSHTPTISNDGRFIAFASDASNLLPNVSDDSNNLRDIFVFDADANETKRVNLTKLNQETIGGLSNQPVISGNGNYIAFRSEATNMLFQGGITEIVVERGGAGYFGNPTLEIKDLDGLGEGANIVIKESGINDYGQIRPDGIDLILAGKNYRNPVVSIVPDSNFPPVQTAILKAQLVNTDGEVYRLQNPFVTSGTLENWVRVSESADGVGGDMPSREPSINYDGSVVVYSTQASNFLENNITREDGQVYYNRPVRQAQARAILVGGIGEIEVNNAGSGYQNGFLQIDDLSGLGRGASASYTVDSFGRISSITVVNPGTNYNLETTLVGIDNPRGGSGFVAGDIRFAKESGRANNRTGGGRIHQIVMTDHGMGYQFADDSNESINSLLLIDGDGVDTDQDGNADAQINPEKIYVDTQSGAIFLKQTYSIEVLSANSLPGTTLTISDANDSVTINFTNNLTATSPLNSIAVTDDNLTSFRNQIITIIENTWGNTSGSISIGPSIEKNATGGTSFSLTALSGKVTVSNPSSIQVIPETNLLFSGAGFSRASPTFSSPPIIHGFSEIASTVTAFDLGNGRNGLAYQEDVETDDIYLFEELSPGQFKRERISRSSFGFPVNYRPSVLVNMPSNRFPAISGNGRHIYFSSDASDEGGLVFDNTNQKPKDNNNGRDIYYFDRKTTALPAPVLTIDLLFPDNSLSHSFAPNSQIPIVVQVEYEGNDLGRVDLFVNSNNALSLSEFLPTFGSNRFSGIYTSPSKGKLSMQAVAIDTNGNQLGSSHISIIDIKESDGTEPPQLSLAPSIFQTATDVSRLPFSVSGVDPGGFIMGVQYFVNGLPYGDEILNSIDSASSVPNFSTSIDFNSSGVNSIFAIGRDNSGFYVSTDIINIPVTEGVNPPTLSMVSGFKSYDLSSPIDVNFTFNNNGQIASLELFKPVGKNFVTSPQVQIFGAGSGAKITADVDDDPQSITYGMVTDLIVDNQGSGYDSKTKIRLVPVVRAIGFGTPAEITLNTTTDINGTNIPTSVGIRRNADQSPIVGSGYVNSPRLVIPPFAGLTRLPRLPLSLVDGGTSGVDPSIFPITLNNPNITSAVLLGGFTQSSIFFEFSTPDPEKIQSVSLMVDGREVDSKTKAPFSFTWIPDEAKEHQVYAVAQDYIGNVIMTEQTYISISQFSGGGVETSFDMGQNLILPTNASVFLNGEASSEFGVVEVEFYMDGRSLGKVFSDGNKSTFFKEVSLSGFSQGTYEISMVARDIAGNESSSFSPATTMIASRQNLLLTVVPSSQGSVNESLQLLYPNTSSPVSFSTQSTIPIIVDFNKSVQSGGLNYAVVFLDGRPTTGVMSQHEVPDSMNPQLNDYITNRFTYSINPNSTSVGKHFIQVVLFDVDSGSPVAQTDHIEIEVTDYAQLSPVITLQEIPEDFKHVTNTSSVVFSVTAEDLDASVQYVQFYVNGEIHGKPISRASLLSQDKSKYLLYFEPKEKGSHSIHAVTSDTSGNRVATLIQSILVTDGSTPSKVQFDDLLKNHEIFFDDLNVLFDSQGGVLQINGLNLDQRYTAEPDIRVKGLGSGLEISAKLDSNGSVQLLTIDSPGIGYDIGNSSITFIPSRRVVRKGTPAQVISTWMDYSPGGPPSEVAENIATMVIQQQELQLQNNNDRLLNDVNATNFGFFGFFGGLPSSYFITEDWETTYSLKRTFDGSLMQGEGYVVSPKFTPPIVIDDGNGRRLIDRLTLTAPVNGTSSVEDFTFVKEGAFAKARLTGGFTRAPIYIQALPLEYDNNIESVSLMVNGVIDEENRLTDPPYNFTWIALDPEDYLLSFVVKDFDGNVYTSPSQTLSIKEYFGSGIGSKFYGSLASEIQIGSESIYSVQASSEFGVAEVEFYLDGESLGYGSPVGSGVYNLIVNFKNLTQGAHFLSYVARDYKGNESGTFNASTTNLPEFKNKEVIVVSSSEQDPPQSFVYPKTALPDQVSYRFWRGQQEVIIMIEALADPDGFIEEIFLFSDGEMLQTSDGNYSISPFPNSSNLSQNLYAFKFIPEKLGIFELKAMVKDNFGTQKFSENTILVEILPSSAQSPKVNLISPIPDTVITNSSIIRFEANATDPDGTMESVQFYVNGLKHGTELLFDKSYSESNFPYGVNWSPPSSGIYTIHAVAKDNDGNEVLSDYISVNVASGNDLIPIIDFEDLSEQYTPNQTIFLSAQVTDASLGSNQNKGIVEEVIFYANGSVVERITQQPFFARWMPVENGLYEVYATAQDNEGNVAISNIQNVRIINETSLNETPALGSLNPSVSGSVVEIKTETFRRNSQINTERTVITGLSTKFLNQLGTGQKIRFSNGKVKSVNTYEIFSIEGDDKLILTKEIEPEDKALISSWSSLEIVPLYRAGSWISLNLGRDVEDSSFQYVDFYVDGTLMSRDDNWPFSGLFIPSKEGNYTLATISVSANGAQNLYTERIEVLPKEGLLPDGSTSIHPLLTRSGSTTIGSELIVTANYDDLDDGMNRVEFYLNGTLAYVDREKPFFYKFKPQTDGSILTTDRAWEVTAVGIDNAGNRISLTQSGNVQGSVILPVAEVKSPSENEEFSAGQAIKIRVDVKGSNMENLLGINSMVTPNPNISLTPRRMNIMANGVIIGIAIESSWGSGIFMTDWICDLDFTGPSGEVELIGSIVLNDEQIDGLSFTPTIISDVVNIKLTEPNITGDTKAGVNQVYQDLLGENPSEQEVNLALSEEIGDSEEYLFDNDDFLRWAAHLSEREVFQNMVDSIAGYKIMIGNFPDYLKISDIMDTYSAIPNYGQDGSLDGDGDGFSLRQENLFQTSDQDATDYPSSAFSMGSFVDDILSSSDYTDIHGEVPVMTPPPNGVDRFTNYEKNRRDFVRIIFQNKYGTAPTIQQETQGSYRISVFDPESKEAQKDQQLMMMQQLSMYSNFGAGGLGGGQGGGNINPFASLLGNTNNQNTQQTAPTFRNGEPAVLFVVNMIAEETINNLDMIWGAPSKRDYYKTAALIASLWQDNMGILSDKLISEFHGKSTEQIISELMKDSRYHSRFGGLSITRHATEVQSVPGWKWLHWLGHFNDEKFPWIYHSGLGWVYVHGPNDDQTWFYLQNGGWLGTSKSIWESMNESSQYLWLYEQNNSRWVAYYLEQPGGNLFWDPQTQNYFRYK